MIDLKTDAELYSALRTLATGATMEEIGKESDGSSKIFKRKLPPNFDAIRFIFENSQKKKITEWKPRDTQDPQALPNTDLLQ